MHDIIGCRATIDVICPTVRRTCINAGL